MVWGGSRAVREDTVAVEGDEVGDTGVEESLSHGSARGATPHEYDVQVSHVSVRQAAGVHDRRHDDDGRTVLVVVEDRDIEAPLQLALDPEAGRGGNVFEVDPTKPGGYGHHGFDQRLWSSRVEANGIGVHTSEVLEDERLALHDGQGGQGPQTSEAEHRAAVRGDRHRGAFSGESPGIGWPAGNGAGHSSHARGVGQGQVLAGTDGDPGRYFDLAAQVVEERAVRDVPHVAIALLQRGGDGNHVFLAGGLEREVDRGAGRSHLDQVHTDDDGTGRTDGLAETRQQRWVWRGRDPYRDRVAGARRARANSWFVHTQSILTASRTLMLRPGHSNTVPNRQAPSAEGMKAAAGCPLTCQATPPNNGNTKAKK